MTERDVRVQRGMKIENGDITLASDHSVFAGTFDTNVAAAGLTLSGTTLAADGSDTDIGINITPKGSGAVVVGGTIELGHASDTTIARASSGVISVEGNNVITTANSIGDLADSTSAAIGIGTIELGHASDTTIARASAGVISVEGSNVLMASNLANGVDNRIATFSGASALNGEANLTFNGSTLALTGDLNIGSGDFFFDDSTGRLGVGVTNPSAPIHVKTSSTGTALLIESTDDGTGPAPDILFFRSSASPANDDDLGHLQFRGKDSGDNDTTYADIYGEIAEVTNGSEAGRMELRALHQGSINSFLRILGHGSGTGSVKVNEDGENIDFVVEGDSDTALFMTDASTDKVGIGTNVPNQKLTIEGTMSLKEQASANADTAAYGQLWVKSDSPNNLYFTNDAGNDVQITNGASIAGSGLSDVVDDTSPQLGGDLDVNGNKITSASNAAITIEPNGTGDINLYADTVVAGDASTDFLMQHRTKTNSFIKFLNSGNNQFTADANIYLNADEAGTGGSLIRLNSIKTTLGKANTNAILTTQGTGDLTLSTNDGTNSGTIVIADGANGNISLTPNGTGNVALGNFTFNADQTVGSGQDNYVLTYDNSAGTIGLEAAAGGGASALGDLSDATTGTSGSNNVGIGSNALDAQQAGGNGNIGLGENALTDLTTGDFNVALGSSALANVTDSDNNIGIGRIAGFNLTSGTRNIAIGYGTLQGADTESDNIAIGYAALGATVTSEHNVVIGNYAGDAITSGNQNTFLGHQSGTSITTAQYSVAVGYRSLYNTDEGSRNTAVGYLSMEGAANNNADQNAAFGGYTLKSVQDGATGNTGLGYLSLSAVTTGDKNIAIGYESGDNITTGSNNVVIGAADVSSATGSDQLSISSGDGSPVWITGDSSGHVSLGNFVFDADQSVGAGQDNYVLTYDHSDGQISLEAAGGGGGASVMGDLTDVSMDITNFVDGFLLQTNSDGSAPTTGTLSNATGNIGIGKDVLSTITSADYTVAIGYQAGDSITTGNRNILIGEFAGEALDTGGDNVILGARAGRAIHDRDGAVMIGRGAGENAQSSGVVFIGEDAGSEATGDGHAYNIAIGHKAGEYGAKGTYNVMIGKSAGEGDSTNTNECGNTTAIGAFAMEDLTTGDNNTAVGYEALKDITTASQSTAVGAYALDAVTTSSGNTAFGYQAMSAATTALYNTAVGYQVNYSGVTTGAKNTMIGFRAGKVLTGGGYNILIGQNAGDNITSGSENVVIGSIDVASATGDRQLSISSGNGSTTWLTGDSSGNLTTNADLTVGSELNIGNVVEAANTVSGSSLANGSSVTLYTVPATTRGFKATIFFKDTSNTEYQIEEIMGYNTGSGVDFTSFGQVYSGAAAIGSLDATDSSGTTLIKFTNGQGSAVNYEASIKVTHMDLS